MAVKCEKPVGSRLSYYGFPQLVRISFDNQNRATCK